MKNIIKIIPDNEKNKKDWDYFSEEYSNDMELKNFSVGINMLHQTDFKEKNIILNAGCGSGYLSSYILKNISNDQTLISTDFSENMIKLSSKNLEKFTNLKNSKIIQMDNHNLKFNNEYFDLYFSNLTFHLVSDPIKCFEEAHRVWKKNGNLIFSVFGDYSRSLYFSIYKDFFDNKKIYLNEDEKNIYKNRSNFHMNDKIKIKEILTKIGFKNLEFTYQDVIFSLNENFLPNTLFKSKNFQSYFKNKTENEKNELIKELSLIYKKKYENEDFIGVNILICKAKKI